MRGWRWLQVACVNSWEPVVGIFSQLLFQWHWGSILKLIMVGAFTPQKLANATNTSALLPCSPPLPPPARKSGLWNIFPHTIEIQTCVSMDHSFLMEPYNCWRYTKLPPSLPGTFRNCTGSLIFKQRSSHPGYIQNCIGWYCLDAYK